MFFTEEKLAARIRELAGFRYREAVKIPSFSFKLDEQGEIGEYPPADGEWKEMRIGDHWTGRDLYAWLAVDIEIPAEWKGRQIVGLFDFGQTGSGTNSGFESLLYVNGSPYQGVDTNHQEVFLPKEAAGENLSLRFRLWSGLEGGGRPKQQVHELKRAELAWLDEAADDLYFTGWAILDTIKLMDVGRPERLLMVQALNHSMNLVDWSYTGSSSFYDSVTEARDLLRSELSKVEKHHPVTVQCIGHTHIDVAWLWQLKHTREKAARSFSTVLRLMEKYPEYIFLQTQPQLYDYIKTDYPEIYEQIRAKVKEGRWEADGGMWLEADCNLTSGESLVRQILLGTRFFREEFGVECTYLWLPDVFGYSWALPQIMKKSGLHTFMTTKISWNQYNRMPHDTFYWKGIDGTEVLTHFITTPRPGRKEGSFYTYNGVIRAESAHLIWEDYRDKSFNREMLMAYGYGDGGGGVNREMLEHRRRLDELPGMPNMVTGRADQYFERLQKTVAETKEYVHTWDGELYLEYHRGTYTSQAYSKKMNRKLELLYRETEFLTSLNSLLGTRGWSNYPQEQLQEGWKIILRNQFHDIIPGSSIREVYEDSHKEYEQAKEIAKTAWYQAAISVTAAGSDDSFTVINSANWKRKDLLRIPVSVGRERGRWTDSQGLELPAQRCGNEWLIETSELPSMGFGKLNFLSGHDVEQKEDIPFTVQTSGIMSPYYELEWNVQGQLVKIYDRTARRNVLAKGSRGNVLQVFEDKPLRHDAWDIDLYYQEKLREVSELRQATVTEIGPLRAVVHFEWQYMNSTISQDMVLYTTTRRIDFETNVDWHERHQLLKVAFPVEVRATEATFDIQFGNVKRPTHWNTSWDLARFESVGHQWADLSEHGYGVSLLNDCKYGYDIKENIMRLSLIKSATRPDYQQDQGEHCFTYGLLPHNGSWFEGDTVREAWQLNNPLCYVTGEPTHPELSLFQIDSNHVFIDAVKKAEDSHHVVLRLHEFAGGRASVEIASGLPIHSWQECDLLERPIGEQFTQSTLRFEIAPYEIKTFLINMTVDK